jgi:hypothetical protein
MANHKCARSQNKSTNIKQPDALHQLEDKTPKDPHTRHVGVLTAEGLLHAKHPCAKSNENESLEHLVEVVEHHTESSANLVKLDSKNVATIVAGEEWAIVVSVHPSSQSMEMPSK